MHPLDIIDNRVTKKDVKQHWEPKRPKAAIAGGFITGSAATLGGVHVGEKLANRIAARATRRKLIMRPSVRTAVIAAPGIFTDIAGTAIGARVFGGNKHRKVIERVKKLLKRDAISKRYYDSKDSLKDQSKQVVIGTLTGYTGSRIGGAVGSKFKREGYKRAKKLHAAKKLKNVKHYRRNVKAIEHAFPIAGIIGGAMTGLELMNRSNKKKLARTLDRRKK